MMHPDRHALLIRTAVVSSNDEREVVIKCLTLGAIDYLIKPLRHNELRHIWTRVWWWRRVSNWSRTDADDIATPLCHQAIACPLRW